MKTKKLLCLLAAVMMLFTFVISTGADFGDYGGEADYGYDGGYDGGYDTGNDYDYGNDYNDDYNEETNYYAGGITPVDDKYSGGGNGALVFGIIIAVAIIAVVLIAKRKGGTAAPAPQKPVVGGGAKPTDVTTLYPVSDYTKADPNFVAADLEESLSNLYVKLQNAWQAKDLEEIRPYLTDAFYGQMDRQLETYRNNRQTNRVERIAVLGVELVGWKQQSGNDVMVARLKTRIVDYVVDDNTGNIVRGSNSTEKFMEYEWSVVRTSGQVTGQQSGTTAQICPSCGAHLDVNHTAKCEYCGTVLTAESHDWALSAIRGLSQRTS